MLLFLRDNLLKFSAGRKKWQTFPRTLITAASFTEESLRLSVRQWISPLKIYEKQFLTFVLESMLSNYDHGGKVHWQVNVMGFFWIQSCKFFSYSKRSECRLQFHKTRKTEKAQRKEKKIESNTMICTKSWWSKLGRHQDQNISLRRNKCTRTQISQGTQSDL